MCQLTHPEKVHAFLREWPGLAECAHKNPINLALYAPQITIPGFDDGFADAFDELLEPYNSEACEAFRYGRAHSTDGKEPLCGDFIAWRHPTFGNFTPRDLAYEFVNAHNGDYSRRVFDGFECLIWLLSQDATWMPATLRDVLIRGFREQVSWWLTDFYGKGAADGIAEALLSRRKNQFRYTKSVKEALLGRIAESVCGLQIHDDPSRIAARFVENRFFEAYYEELERVRSRRKTGHEQG